MITQRGWNQQFMISDYKKEAAYDAGVTMNSTNACSRRGYDLSVDWADKIVNDESEVTGTEHGTDQDIVSQGVKLTYKEPKARPNSVNAAFARAFGNITATQDGAFAAWKQKIIPITVGSSLPTAHAEHKKGGLQYKYTGLMTESLEVSGKEGDYISLTEILMGSGTRSTSATAFPAYITESWMKLANTKAWMESGASISLRATLTQGGQDISSGSGTSLDVRMKDFAFKWNNNPEGQGGFGGAGVFTAMEYKRRKGDLSATLIFNDAAELGLYTAQTAVALEIDCKGALIAAGGSMYYGFQLVFPRLKFSKAPLPDGGIGDALSCKFNFDLQEDGTNPVVVFEGYSAKTGYMS